MIDNKEPSKIFKTRFDKIYALIFSLYVGTGPIYWLPGLSPETFYLLKSVLFSIAISYPFLKIFTAKTKSTLTFPGGKSTALLLIAFLIMTSVSGLNGIKNGNSEAAAADVIRALQITAFLYACGFIIKMNAACYVATRSTGILGLLCAISYALILSNPNYPNPLNELLTVQHTGLGGSRTGWSPSIALYLPWLYSYTTFPALISLIFASFLVLNQISVAGRTGLASSIIPILVWGILSRKFKAILISALSVTVSAAYILINKDSLRLSGAEGNGFLSLNEISTGRWEQYEAALKAISEAPLQGYGAGNLIYGGSEWLVHNTILKLTVEGGIFYGIVAAAIVAIPIIRGIKPSKNNTFIRAALLTVIAGAVTSLFEPGVMFGSFNQISFWWFCFSICVMQKSAKIK